MKKFNRSHFQWLAQERIDEALVLLGNSKFSGAYYLSGYCVENALKACILSKEYSDGLIFRERDFSKKCWTHDLQELVQLAQLGIEKDREMGSNADFSKNWGIVSNWDEESRYDEKAESEAREIINAITELPNGVLTWLKKYW